MLKQLLAQATMGFSITDLPILFLQLSISALLAILIRNFWKKGNVEPNEIYFLNYLVPIQVIFTTIAIFSLKTPWILVLFGLLALIPVIGNDGFSLRSKVFYLTCIFIAFGCGAANLFVTTMVTLFLLLPCMYFYKSK